MVAYQVPLSVGFSRQEYWSGLSFPSPGDLPDPGMEPESSALAGGFFTTEPPGKPYIILSYTYLWPSLVAQMVKNLRAMRGTRVQSLGWKDPLEEDMATHSSILAWRIPWTEDPGVLYSPWGCKESDTTEQLSTNIR